MDEDCQFTQDLALHPAKPRGRSGKRAADVHVKLDYHGYRGRQQIRDGHADEQVVDGCAHAPCFGDDPDEEGVADDSDGHDDEVSGGF